jgi:pimeloyl-ACP methyl ester carboxylesterase
MSTKIHFENTTCLFIFYFFIISVLCGMVEKLMIGVIRICLNGLSVIAPNAAGKLGFRIFCTPFAAGLKDYQLKFLDTAEKFTLEIEGKKAQCYKWGNGSKKILFVHGWASHTFRWKSYIEYFTKNDYTVYAFDARAHGLSEGKTLNLIINANYIKVVVAHIGQIDAAVCHSFGGFSMAYLLHHYPNTNIGKTIIMAAPGEAMEFFTFYKEKLGLTNKTTQIIIERFKKNINQTPEYFSTPAFAKTIKKPCLIIHDKNDNEAPLKTALSLHKNWQGSQMIVTEGLGHHLKSNDLIVQVENFIENK